MSIYATFKALNMFGKIGSIVGPPLILGAAWYLVDKKLDGIYENGAASRDGEVAALTLSRDDYQGKLSKAKGEIVTIAAKLESARSKITALEDGHAKALKAQADGFNATQKITGEALRLMAANDKDLNQFYAKLTADLKDVNYESDPNTGRCVIRGGGRVLQNAASGKIGN